MMREAKLALGADPSTGHLFQKTIRLQLSIQEGLRAALKEVLAHASRALGFLSLALHILTIICKLLKLAPVLVRI